MKAVYIFSGLGADERVLQEIDLSGYQVIFVQWIPPLYQDPNRLELLQNGEI